MTNPILGFSVCAPAIAASMFFQTAAAQDADLQRDAVVITATKVPTPKQEIGSALTSVSAADIEAKQERTLSDVLQVVPGLNVVQSGGPGGQTSVFMRGADSNHVKVFVDGVDVSDPSSPNGGFDFGQFLTSDIDRVEILRGPQSGLYGSDAIGGVINVITKSGERGAHVTAELEGGSFGTFNQSAALSGSTGALHYAANLAHFQSASTPVTPLDALAPGEARNNDFYDNITAATKLGYQANRHLSFDIAARYTNTRLKFTGEDYPPFPAAAFPDAAQSEYDTRQYYARASARLAALDERFVQTLALAYSSISSTTFSPDTSSSAYNSGDRIKIDWQGNVRVSPREMVVLGAEREREEIRAPISADTAISAGYGELQSNIFENFYDTINVRYDSNTRFGAHATYRFAPTYRVLATGTKLSASLGSGFKAPSLSQLYQNFPAFSFSANPNLRPETSVGVDAGFEQSALGGRAAFGATYFYNRIKDLIADNATFTSYANIGRAHTEGVESFASYTPVAAVTMRLDYTYTEARDDLSHQQLLRRPRNKFNFDARWRVSDKLSLNADLASLGSWVDGNRDFSIPRLKAPGYTSVDAAASYDVAAHVTIYGRVTNLFDERYQDPVGFLRPSRGVFLGVRTRL